MQARYKSLRFILGGWILATIVAGLVELGPAIAFYRWLDPVEFGQRTVAAVLSIGIAVVCFVPAALLWLRIASKYELPVAE